MEPGCLTCLANALLVEQPGRYNIGQPVGINLIYATPTLKMIYLFKKKKILLLIVT